MTKNVFRVAAAAIAATMTLASVSPALAQHRGPAPYYQDRDNHREHNRLHQRDVYHQYSYLDRGNRAFEREHQRWDRERSRYGNRNDRYEDRSEYRINGGTAFAALAGIAIGAAIVQNGERRQYYQDRNTNRYYYRNERDRQYYWDPSYRR